MPTFVRVLIVEDNPSDAELMAHELRRAGFDPDWQRVDTQDAYLAGLDRSPDLILSDFSLPQFDGLRALRLLQERGLDIPFIVVTGAVGEEVAVECMRQGAADYLLKDRPARLGQAAAHALAQRQLRAEKRQTDAMFHTLAETTSAAIFITEGSRILYANPAATAITGYTHRELLTMELWQVAHPAYQDSLKQRGVRQPWAEHIPSRYELKIVTKAGEERWLDISAGEIELDGKPASLLTAFDITERDRAEKALRQAHAELEVRVQERTAELALANEALRTEIAERILAEEERERLLRQAQEYVKQLAASNEQLQMQSEKMTVQAEELYAQAAELQAHNVHLEHLTQLLTVEQARLNAVLRQMPAGVIIADASGQVILANEQMDQLLHGQYQQVGSPDRYLRYETYFLNGQAYLSKENPLARTLNTGEIVADEEMYLVRDDGSRAVMLVSSSPIRDREGHIIAGVMTFHDITERKQAEEQAQQLAAMQERQRLARELHDSVSQALYGIALGARTARTLLDRDPSQAADPLDYIQKLAGAGLAEMRALIFELRPESLETEGLAVAIAKQVEFLRARHGIEIEMALCQEPVVGLGVKEALYRIAQEALHNAVKHAQATLFRVRLECVGDEVILEVRDNGVGFDPGASFPGHLGLRSMRERVARLGGLLEIESAPGQGTCIRAHIPERGVLSPSS